MAEFKTVVTTVDHDKRKLPAWASSYALAVRFLTSRGLLGEAAEHIRFSRQGGLHPFDIAMFLLCYLMAGGGAKSAGGQRKFSARCSPWRGGLAALAGREEWATQATVSRCLKVAGRADLAGMGRWLLGTGSALADLLGHPAAMYRDAFGQPYCVLDYDPSIIAIRQRALPEGEDLPSAIARSTAMAAPGYHGRKRGEVQVAAHLLQHAGTGTWAHLEAESGNPHPQNVAERIALSAVEVGRLAGVEPARVVVRADGGGDVTAVFLKWCEHGLIPLVRMTRYVLLDAEPAVGLLRTGAWQPVADSGSGPRREALDLGTYELQPRGDAADPPGPAMTARLVVTRFAAEAKHGAGHFVDGYQYELFGTRLDSGAWPAAEVAKCYFERAAIENRLAQLNREVKVLRVHSTDPAGQVFGMLIGLWAFNLKVALGGKLAGNIAPPPEQLPAAPPVSVLSGSTPTSGPMPDALPPSTATSPCLPATATAFPTPPRQEVADRCDSTWPDRQTVREALAGLPWRRIARKHPGWYWNGAEAVCPAGNPAQFNGVIVQDKGKYARFGIPAAYCAVCERRSQCTKSSSPAYSRHINVPGADALPLGTRLGRQHRITDWERPASSQRLTPPVAVPAGPRQVQSPRLLPASLRALWQRVADACRVEVDAPPSPPPPKDPEHIATDEAGRQHRRQTWAVRLQRNARTAPTTAHFRILRHEAALVRERILQPSAAT